jgi:hypothetical protein
MFSIKDRNFVVGSYWEGKRANRHCRTLRDTQEGVTGMLRTGHAYGGDTFMGEAGRFSRKQ